MARLGPQSRGLVLLLGALTGLTALSIDMSLPALSVLTRVFATSADAAALTLSMLGMALATPNAIAAAREPVPHMAGFASSLIGCLQTGGGSVVGYILGALYNHTAVPMTAAVAISAALAGLSYLLLRRPGGRAGLPGERAC